MSWIKKFLKDPLTAIFEQGDAVGEGVPTYNETQVKVGIMRLRDTLANSDPHNNKGDYNRAFQGIILKTEMSAEDIEEQVDTLLNRLIEHDLITAEEQSRASRPNLIASMIGEVIRGAKSATQNAEEAAENEEQNTDHDAWILDGLSAVRYDQELGPDSNHMNVVHRRTPNNE